LLHGDGPSIKEDTPPRKKRSRRWTVDGQMVLDIATCTNVAGWWIGDVNSLAAY